MHATFSPRYLDLVRAGRTGHPGRRYGTDHQRYDCSSGASTLQQPEIPAPGYIWTPGYWAYGPDGYFWVPGTWVEPPSVGLLWTPGYWGWHDGSYGWNAGYWGPHIGFYGGVNYGYGYGGVGYEGGRWNNGVFAYNRTVNNFGGSRSPTSIARP